MRLAAAASDCAIKCSSCLLPDLIVCKRSKQYKHGAVSVLRREDVARLPPTEQAAGRKSAVGTFKSSSLLSLAWEGEENTPSGRHVVWDHLLHGQAAASPGSTACTVENNR